MPAAPPGCALGPVRVPVAAPDPDGANPDVQWVRPATPQEPAAPAPGRSGPAVARLRRVRPPASLPAPPARSAPWPAVPLPNRALLHSLATAGTACAPTGPRPGPESFPAGRSPGAPPKPSGRAPPGAPS